MLRRVVESLEFSFLTMMLVGAGGPNRKIPCPNCLGAKKHEKVFEYDGAFQCLDCEAQWGALSGSPKMPERLLYTVTGEGCGGAAEHKKSNLTFIEAHQHAVGLQALGYENIRVAEQPPTAKAEERP